LTWGTSSVLSSDDCASPLAAPHSIYSPELNPVERVWLYLRERFLSHRVLDGYDAIVTACCQAWNALTPERLRSLTHQPWVQKVTS
jgi:transposase